MTLLLLTDALHKMDGDGIGLHMDLLDVQSRLLKRRQQWFCCADETPLGWYAALVNSSPATLLAARCADIPAAARQAWVASPYHAQLGRDTVRLMPEGCFSWSDADSAWLCDLLNPLLLEEGMSLHAVGAALLLACVTPLDAAPLPFAAIVGGLLPNRHPNGPDGGRLMRLLAEIQMSLHVVTHREGQSTRAGQPDISGLWLWGASALPAVLPADLPCVATRNPFLQAVSDGRDAVWIISEAEKLHELLAENADFPNTIVLTGASRAVLLTKSILPRFGKPKWVPDALKSEATLCSILHTTIQTTR